MLTFASYITLLRIALTPVVVYFVYQEQWNWAALFFLIAAVTDLFDGLVARKFNQQSDLGQIVDPIADKCLIMATLYSLLMKVSLGYWMQGLVWFLLLKELILLVGGALLKLRYNFFIVPSILSRAASLAEIFLILFLFINLLSFDHVYFEVLSMVLIGNFILSLCLLIRYLKIILCIVSNL